MQKNLTTYLTGGQPSELAAQLGWRGTRGPCVVPGHPGNNNSKAASLHFNPDGSIGYTCHSHHCAGGLSAVEDLLGLHRGSINGRGGSQPPAPRVYLDHGNAEIIETAFERMVRLGYNAASQKADGLPPTPADLDQQQAVDSWDSLTQAVAASMGVEWTPTEVPDWTRPLTDTYVGKPATENQKMVRFGIGAENTPLCPTEPKVYIAPVRTREYYCLIDTSVKVRMRSDGQTVKTRYACGKCGPCLRWWRFRKRHLWEWGTSAKPEQTIITVSGLADDDLASAAAIAVGRAGDGQRFVSLIRNPLTYHWDALIVFANPQTPKVCLNIQRGRDREAQDCQIDNRPVSGAEIENDWLPVSRRTPGWHKPCRFVGWGAGADREVEYAYGDGYVASDADAPDVPFDNAAPIDAEIHPYADAPMDTNAKRTAKLRARNRVHIRRWLTGVTLDPDALLTLRTARLQRQRGDWFGCIASGQYDGPKRLVIDLARALDADGLLSLNTPDGLRLASAYINDPISPTPRAGHRARHVIDDLANYDRREHNLTDPNCCDLCQQYRKLVYGLANRWPLA